MHYWTVTTTHVLGGRHGVAATRFYIGKAKPGYKVPVDVTVRDGARTGSCATSFTPRHR